MTIRRSRKDETEEGITGQPIPRKNLGPRQRHEFEKKRRAERKKKDDPRVGDSFSSRRMTGSRGHGSEYEVNPRISYRHNEEFVIGYLLDEGFASDERSAESIMGAMSEAWVESIFEEFKDLTPEKESRVKNRVGELARDMEVSNARMNELKKKPLGKYRPKIKAEKEEIVSSARRKHNLIKNATDALIRTKVGRQASITKKIYDTKKKLKELGED
jgi:hypothetical protein